MVGTELALLKLAPAVIADMQKVIITHAERQAETLPACGDMFKRAAARMNAIYSELADKKIIAGSR